MPVFGFCPTNHCVCWVIRNFLYKAALPVPCVQEFDREFLECVFNWLVNYGYNLGCGYFFIFSLGFAERVTRSVQEAND